MMLWVAIGKMLPRKFKIFGAKLGPWKCRQLSIFGRSLIVKSLGIPQIDYLAAMLENTVRIQTMIFKFIWKERKDKFKGKRYLEEQ